jgi:hypothetical protein
VSLFVVDASVAIKWFLPEIHSDAALRLLAGEHTLHAPDLIFSEFGNVLWKRFRKREISRAEVSATIEAPAICAPPGAIFTVSDSAGVGNRMRRESYGV